MYKVKILTFDIEIANAVPQESIKSGYSYCKGWDDKAGMGISLMCAYLSWRDEYRFFDENNCHKIILLFQEADLITGFNIHGFDVSLLKATLERLGHDTKTHLAGKTYDLFLDIKKSLKTRYAKGWKMGNIAQSCLGEGKVEDGANAPFLWQDGKIADVATYVASDVRLEHKLFLYAMRHGRVLNQYSETGQTYCDLTTINDVKSRLIDIRDKNMKEKEVEPIRKS